MEVGERKQIQVRAADDTRLTTMQPLEATMPPEVALKA